MIREPNALRDVQGGKKSPETEALLAQIGLDQIEVALMPGESREQAIAAVRSAVEETGDLPKVLEDRRRAAEELLEA